MSEHSFHSILNTWPIVSTLAKHTPAGDLISLARIDSRTRTALHGFDGYDSERLDNTSTGLSRDTLNIGHHQTKYWTLLKDLALFECSCVFHTKGVNIHPCKYCSTLICEACIVKSSFANRHENTFKNRVRYLCHSCWESGNLRKDYRYPSDYVSREQFWKGRNYAQRGNFCTCTLKYDGWLCITCKNSQNSLASVNGVPHKDTPPQPSQSKIDQVLPCYGLGCGKYLNDAEDYERERRRICLWCSKQLPRQFGGEERYRWDSKVIEARALNAASRSADIDEWARNRFRSLTMSRREMRGTAFCLEHWDNNDSAEHDRPQFLRHLDAINYRNLMPEVSSPDPETVWKSKNGVWKYKREFLQEIGARLLPVSVNVNNLSSRSLSHVTESLQEGKLTFARTNGEIRTAKQRMSRPSSPLAAQEEALFEVKARILELHRDFGMGFEDFKAFILGADGLKHLETVLNDNYGIEIDRFKIRETLVVWLKDIDHAATTKGTRMHGKRPREESAEGSRNRNGYDDDCVPPNDPETALPTSFSSVMNDGSSSHAPEDQEQDEVDAALLEYAIRESIANSIGQSDIEGIDPHSGDPPPYSP